MRHPSHRQASTATDIVRARMIERRYGCHSRDWLAEFGPTSCTWISSAAHALVFADVAAAQAAIVTLERQHVSWPDGAMFTFAIIHARAGLPAWWASTDIDTHAAAPAP